MYELIVYFPIVRVTMKTPYKRRSDFGKMFLRSLVLMFRPDMRFSNKTMIKDGLASPITNCNEACFTLITDVPFGAKSERYA